MKLSAGKSGRVPVGKYTMAIKGAGNIADLSDHTLQQCKRKTDETTAEKRNVAVYHSETLFEDQFARVASDYKHGNTISLFFYPDRA